MAQDSAGTKNQPIFSESGAPQLGTDLSLVSNYAASVGNHKVGTTADKTALSGANLWEGLSFYDTTLDLMYVYTGSVWKEIHLAPELPTPQTASTGVVNTIVSTSTSFATLPDTEVKFDVVLTAACWYRLSAGAWLFSSNDDVRFGIKLTGATVQTPQTPSWGNVLLAQSGEQSKTGSVTKVVQLAAGTTTVYCAAYKSTSGGTNTVGYAYLDATPIRWA